MMRALAFTVTVRTPSQRLRFPAIGKSSGEVHAAELERFGGLCSVAVLPMKEVNRVH